MFGPHANTNIDEPFVSRLTDWSLPTSDALGSLIKCQSVKYLKFANPVNLHVREA